MSDPTQPLIQPTQDSMPAKVAEGSFGTFATTVSTAGGAPAQQMMVDPWKTLDGLKKIQVKERIDVVEALTNIEMRNKYDIYDANGKPVFFAGETTDWWARNCVPGDCRAFSVDIATHAPPGERPLAPFLKVTKEAQCTCCCFNRPVVEVTANAAVPHSIGTITNPYTCCDRSFVVKDEQGAGLLEITSDCKQPGVWCPLPCGACKEIKFEVRDAATKERVGSMTHIIPDWFKFALTPDVDNYDVDFGSVSDKRTKALLLSAALFIDFRYFEQGGHGRNKNHARSD
eukprot:GDKI01009039.1.p2 GENE.GDKI01009039.1~~GDKI01009039.1.p2  ORF type:complete len:286 (+),score=94.73 GDKI01009039.1:80-937(+)